MSTTPRVPMSTASATSSLAGAFGHQPPLFAAFSEWYGNFWSRGVLDPSIKELVRLRNARVTDCGY